MCVGGRGTGKGASQQKGKPGNNYEEEEPENEKV